MWLFELNPINLWVRLKDSPVTQLNIPRTTLFKDLIRPAIVRGAIADLHKASTNDASYEQIRERIERLDLTAGFATQEHHWL